MSGTDESTTSDTVIAPVPPAVATPTAAKEKSGRGRGFIAWVFVVIASLLLPVAVVAFWGQRTITDTERYLATVAPLAESAVIKAAIVNKATETIMTTIEEQEAVSELLDGLPPVVVQKLQAPIQGAVQGLVTQVATKIVESPKFEEFWVEINKQFQTGLIAALEGTSDGPLQIEGNEVVLDTSVVAAEVQQALVDRGLTVLEGKELPDAANQKIVVLKSDELAQAQLIYKFSVPLARFLIPLVAILLLAAVGISRRRARIVMGAGIGIVMGSLVLSIGLGIGKEALASAAPTTAAQEVLNVFWVTLTRYLATSVSSWVTGGVVIALLGWFGGRSEPATKLRGYISGSLVRAGGKVTAPWLQSPAGFLRSHWRGAFILLGFLATAVLFLTEPITVSAIVWTTVMSLAIAALITAITGVGTGGAEAGAETGDTGLAPAAS